MLQSIKINKQLAVSLAKLLIGLMLLAVPLSYSLDPYNLEAILMMLPLSVPVLLIPIIFGVLILANSCKEITSFVKKLKSNQIQPQRQVAYDRREHSVTTIWIAISTLDFVLAEIFSALRDFNQQNLEQAIHFQNGNFAFFLNFVFNNLSDYAFFGIILFTLIYFIGAHIVISFLWLRYIFRGQFYKRTMLVAAGNMFLLFVSIFLLIIYHHVFYGSKVWSQFVELVRADLGIIVVLFLLRFFSVVGLLQLRKIKR